MKPVTRGPQLEACSSRLVACNQQSYPNISFTEATASTVANR